MLASAQLPAGWHSFQNGDLTPIWSLPKLQAALAECLLLKPCLIVIFTYMATL